MTPSWLLDVVAAFMLVVAGVSAARLAVARPWRPDSVIIDADIAHLLMAIAMAGMLAPSLRTLPGAGWEVIFGVLIVVFGFRVVRDARANGVRARAGAGDERDADGRREPVDDHPKRVADEQQIDVRIEQCGHRRRIGGQADDLLAAFPGP